MHTQVKETMAMSQVLPGPGHWECPFILFCWYLRQSCGWLQRTSLWRTDSNKRVVSPVPKDCARSCQEEGARDSDTGRAQKRNR